MYYFYTYFQYFFNFCSWVGILNEIRSLQNAKLATLIHFRFGGEPASPWIRSCIAWLWRKQVWWRQGDDGGEYTNCYSAPGLHFTGRGYCSWSFLNENHSVGKSFSKSLIFKDYCWWDILVIFSTLWKVGFAPDSYTVVLWGGNGPLEPVERWKAFQQIRNLRYSRVVGL